jgi:hypothetical protein
VSIITRKIKTDHPNWKLPERRIKKFVKRYMSKDKNPAGADDDASVSTNQYKNEKKAFSPSRSLSRMFSSRSKKKNLSSPPDQLESSFDTAPEAAPEPAKEEEENEEDTPVEETEKESKEEIEQIITTEKEDIAKEIVYETVDHDKVDSSNDCFASCSIM